MAVFISGIISGVTFVSRLCGGLAAAMVVLAMGILCELVLQRYGFSDYSAWQGEMATYLMIAIAFVGAPYVALTKGHIHVNLLPASLGAGPSRVLATLSAGISIIVTLVLTLAGWGLFYESYVEGWTLDTALGLPLWVPYLALPLGAGVLTLQYGVNLFCLLCSRAAPFPLRAEPDKEEART